MPEQKWDLMEESFGLDCKGEGCDFKMLTSHKQVTTCICVRGEGKN
jgi:hypothetical protein